MRITPVISALALSSASFINAQENSNKYLLDKDPLYTQGINALTDHLPAIASKKFALILESKAPAPASRIRLLYLLAEAQIRAIQPSEALVTLENPLVKDLPESIFWKGQALATGGRYNDAIQILEQTPSNSKNYHLAQIKIASLAAALDDINKAISILNKSAGTNKNTSTQTHINLANLYIAKKDPEKAANALKKIKEPDQKTIIAQKIIQSQIDILQENYAPSIDSLSELLKSPENLDSKALGFSSLYLSDAYYLNGQTQEAIDTLVTYLDRNPSELLGAIFARLETWIPNDAAITDNNIKQLITWAGLDQSEPGDQLIEVEDKHSDLSAFAHYYYAKYLAKQEDVSNKTAAILEFDKLRNRYPTHILSGTSLTDTATTQLVLGQIDSAKSTLIRIQKLETPIAPLAKQQASFLLGKLNLDERNYQAAAEAFQAVVDSAKGELQTKSIINAASCYLAASDTENFQKLQQSISDQAVQINLTLEYAIWLSKQNKLSARSILQEFLHSHPKHPRVMEAELELALHCLQVAPVDTKLCNSIIPRLEKSQLSKNQQADYYELLCRNAVSNNNFAEAANQATQYMEAFPGSSKEVEFILLKGQALYHNGQHNEARQTLSNIVNAYPESPLRDYAEYYAAMSAKLEGTPQSENDAIRLLSKLKDADSNLASEALIQLGKIYLNRSEPIETINILQPIYDKKPQNKKPLDLGILLASAHHDLGNIKPIHFQSAIGIFDTLIKQYQDNPQARNEIYYSKGLTLQHMGENDAAIETYYSVINTDTDKAITEWKWYYKCGFTAINLLEEMKNPRGAISIANKLASSKGPRAKEASDRARLLEMNFMIWK